MQFPSETSLLNVIDVATPCAAVWEQMRGDDKSRICESCSKRVYNLSAMTSEEAVTLIMQMEETPCIRMYRRKDGTLINQDCPVGIRKAFRWSKRIAVGVLITIFGGSALLAASRLTGDSLRPLERFGQLVSALFQWNHYDDAVMGDMVFCPGPPVSAPSVTTTNVPPPVPVSERLSDHNQPQH